MARRSILGVVAAVLLLASSVAVARDLAADAPYPMPYPESPAAKVPPKPPHQPRHAAATVPIPPSAPRLAATEVATKTKSVPLPEAAPNRPATAKPAPSPKLAALPPAKPDMQPKPAPAGDRTADVFAGLSADERLKIQASLLWAGDYTGASGSEDPMLTAIKNFQKRIKANVTGVLTGEQRARLLAAANSHAEAFGWTVVADPATGIRIGLPSKLVPQAHDTADGTRWSSSHGEVQIETFRLRRPELKLAAVFEAMKRTPASRRIEYSTLRDDGFVISGIQGLKNFTTRATMRDGEVRGFTMSYDQAMESIVAPVVVAMASAFTPFPERSAPFAALTKPVEYGSGIVVSPRGHIITAARLTDGCQVLLASGLGNAERIAEDGPQGLALLRVYGRHDLKPVVLPDRVQNGDAKLVGIPDPREQNGRSVLSEVTAHLMVTGGIEMRQSVPMAGLSGAAAIDAQGRLAGIAEMRSTAMASNEPALAPIRLVGIAAIRDFLAAHGVTRPTQGGDARAAVVRIICVRK